MDIKQEALKLHKEHRGKIEVVGKVQIKDMHDLALVYTPGVAEPCLKSTRMLKMPIFTPPRGTM